MPLHPTRLDVDGRPEHVTVKKTEEKGSDVALASHLLIDGMRGDHDVYVVCTNDSDLVTPMRMLRTELSRDVGLLSPMQPKRASNELKQTEPLWHRQVNLTDIVACQLPSQLADHHGTIHRPLTWRRNSEGSAEAEPSNQ